MFVCLSVCPPPWEWGKAPKIGQRPPTWGQSPGKLGQRPPKLGPEAPKRKHFAGWGKPYLGF